MEGSIKVVWHCQGSPGCEKVKKKGIKVSSEPQLSEERDTVAFEKMLNHLCVFATLALAAGLICLFLNGFNLLCLIQALAALVVYFLKLSRHRFAMARKIHTLAVLFLVVGSLGFLSYGLVANTLILFILHLFLAGEYLNKKAYFFYLAVSVLVYAALAFIVVVLGFTPPGYTDGYHTTLPAWIIPITGAFTFGVVLTAACSMRRRQMTRLNHELEDKNRQIAALADHDELTGLPIMRVFREHLYLAIQASKREERLIAVCFLDLDGFKRVNDSHGHAAGDEVLKHVSRQLESAVRPQDVVARKGGDEFLILLNSLKNEVANIEDICHRILDAVQKPITYENTPLQVSASIGVAALDSKATTIEALIKGADSAMYEVKRSGKGGVKIFNLGGATPTDPPEKPDSSESED